MYDIAIIGGGPAGLSAALYALRAGKKTVIFEGNALGGTLNQIEKLENYPGFKSVSGPALTKKMVAQIMRFKPTVVRQFVVSVFEEEGAFTLYTNTDEYSAKRVVYAGGVQRTALKAAENFSGSGVSYCATCDGHFYKGKTVAVLGKGYTADEDIKYLLPLCKKVYLIGKLEGADEVEQIDDKVVRLIGDEALTGIELKSGRVLDVDGLFIALGANSSGADILGGVQLNDGKIKDRLYAAGDAAAPFKQVVWACASGAKAATEALREK